ncbi:mannitol dehydrogenase [Phytophthora nicotianae]|uniref:Mannitol dehydrogenase n=1 Tax=Phytophthora nicotianae TaxID=4792 RepID=A0A0W8D1J5_PHYNI|nr:mannitol dehydrogenase [Phytophthora nicotianae]
MSKKAADDPLGGGAGLSSGDLFVRNLSVMSVAHIARGVGFDAVQKSAADALTEILAKYIQRIGASAKEIAELAGRAQPKATDVVQAFQDLEPAPVEIKDLIKTLETAKRPFPRDVPAFPARKRDISGNTIEQAKIGRREDCRLIEKAQVRQSLHGLQTVAAKKPAVIVHQPTWNAFQGSTGDNATENPFVQAPITIFSGPDRDFVPNVDRDKAQSKNQLDNNVTIPKLSSQELGKEEKILTGTFHDGDSE